MTRSEAQREALIDQLTDHVLTHGLSAASLRPLAKAVGTSDRMLIYYFGDKASLITAIIERIATRLTATLATARTEMPIPLAMLQAQLAPLLFDEALWPYMRIWLEIAAFAAKGDPLYCAVGEQIARGFLSWGASQLESDEPMRDAARLLISIEGMLVLHSVGLDDVCAAAL